MYKSANLTIKHLNQLRLLGSIDKKVREMNQEANRFLLSDTQTLLHSLIQGSDSPFIFEKIGTQLNLRDDRRVSRYQHHTVEKLQGAAGRNDEPRRCRQPES